MWLLNTKTLKLEHAIDPEESNMKYAILSHTWEHEEVTFQQLQDLERARKMAGFAKIEQTCTLANDQGLDYVWVDTCCIDKSSSAELSEAINSMFNYYKLAEVCYVFLSDMPKCGAEELRILEKSGLSYGEIEASESFQALCRCRWFTRGWTLQELIAPLHVQFYNAKWKLIGTKRTIPSILSNITGIDDETLMNMTDLLSIPVCARMSWAAKRETTRVEDIAYCLLGIFDVNLPLIYGEGYRAFQRLQEEIVRTSGDVTILAWSSDKLTPEKYLPTPYKNSKTPKFRGPFAWSPSEFAGHSSLRQLDPFKSIHVRMNIVNGTVELFSIGDLPLTHLDYNQYPYNQDIGLLHLDIHGSGNHYGRHMMMTPLGYAMISCDKGKVMWTSSEHWRPHVPHRRTSKIRIISHQDAMRLNRSDRCLEPYLLRFDGMKPEDLALRTDTIAWPARYFDPLGHAFIFARPDVYPTQPVHILGLAACSVSIPFLTQDIIGTHELDLILCCGAFTPNRHRQNIEPWGITFCRQGTDQTSRDLYDWLRANMDEDMTRASNKYSQDDPWDDTRTERKVPSFRASIATKLSLHYENEARLSLSKSLVNSLRHKIEEARSPDDDGLSETQKTFFKYTTRCATGLSPDISNSGAGSIFKFIIDIR